MDNTDLPEIQRAFWQGVARKLADRPRTPLYIAPRHINEPENYVPQHQNLPSEVVHYVLITDSKTGHLRIKLQIEDEHHGIFNNLKSYQEEIESEISPDLEWATGKAWDKVILQRNGNISTEEERWDNFQEWLIKYGEKFDHVFGSYLEKGID